MPYIIKVTRFTDSGRAAVPGGATVKLSKATERAVATLDGVRGYLAGLLELGRPNRANHRDAHRAVVAIQGLPEAGGTVSLPDGTAIEVEHVSVEDIARAVRAEGGAPAHWHLFGADLAEVVDAFNAAQAVAS